MVKTVLFHKKKYTKSYKKAFRSIDEFIDIKHIYSDTIILKDGSIIKGIKLTPFDIWTAGNEEAANAISILSYAFKQFSFEIYQCLVYSPNTMDLMITTLLNKIESSSDIQKNILLEDIAKIHYFSENNKKVEFFLMIKNKNERQLMRNYNQMINELSRFFLCTALSYIDYITYINWTLDVDIGVISRGYYQNKNFIVDEKELAPETESVEKENNHSIDMPISDYYKLYTIDEDITHFQINDRYYSLILVKSLPTEHMVGLLNYVGKNQNIKTYFSTKESLLDLTEHIKKEVGELEQNLKEARTQKDLNGEEKIRKKLLSLNSFVKEMNKNSDKTLDMSLCFIVSHDDFDEFKHLRNRFIAALKSDGFKVFIPKRLQLALFKYFNPIFSKDARLTNTLNLNVGYPISTTSFALTYPYHYSYLEDPNGFLYGYETNLNGAIVLDPFFYRNNENESVYFNRLTGNTIILGKTGSGKTADTHLFVRYCIRENLFLMWVDPENKNKRVAIQNGGTYIEFGDKESRFNVWQLTRVSSDEEDKKKRESQTWDTDLAIVNAIDRFKNAMKLYSPEISKKTLNMVGIIANQMYDDFGISQLKTFKHLKNTEFPTMSDFANTLIKMLNDFKNGQTKNDKFAEQCENLLIEITPWLEEHRFLFDGPTTANVDLRPGNIVAIGTKRLYQMDTNVSDALYYIICDMATSYCLQDEVDSAIIIDECHIVIKNHFITTLIDQLFRRSRKYDNLSILATQEALDFDKNKAAILSETTYIIVKIQNTRAALNKLNEMIGLDDTTLNRISQFKRGDSYFICGNQKFYMHTLLTLKEKEGMATGYAS